MYRLNSIRRIALQSFMFSVVVLMVMIISLSAWPQTEIVPMSKGKVKSMRIRELLDTVEGTPEESPRLGKTHDGYLHFFGAPPNVKARLNEELRDAEPEVQTRGFLAEHGAAFGITSPNVDFRVKKIRTKEDRTYVRMNQTYEGVPVFCAETIVQLDNYNSVSAVISDIMRDSSEFDSGAISTTPSISAEEAMRIALREKQKEFDSLVSEQQKQLERMLEEDVISIELYQQSETMLSNAQLTVTIEPELLIYDPQVVGNKGDPVLVWMMTVGSDKVGLHLEKISPECLPPGVTRERPAGQRERILILCFVFLTPV